MSGSKNTYSSVGDGGEIIGQAILTVLALPVGAAVLAFYTGKVLVKGVVAGGELATEAIKKLEDFSATKENEHKQELNDRIKEACDTLNSKIDQASQYCDRILQMPFMNDGFVQKSTEFIDQIASDFSSNLTLENALEMTLKLDNMLESLRDRQNAASACEQERTNLLAQMEQTRKMIQSQSDIPADPELAILDEFERRLNDSTIETFHIVKADISNWTIALTNRIENIQENIRVNSIVSSLWSSLPVSQELAQKYDPAGYSELKRVEAHLKSNPQPEILLRFQNSFKLHQSAVEAKKRQEDELQAERERIRKIFEPKLEVLVQRLELADSVIVNRWEGNMFNNLKQMLETFKENLAQGNFQSMESDFESWNEAYTNMLTQAGLKQQAEERRQYIVEAMKAELPKLGFDIQSLSSRSDSTSDTVIKVVPRIQNEEKRRRITITVPQVANEPVKYKFDGYDVEYTRVDGCPVVENDTGKQAVLDISAALKPYGIFMSEPDWGGNPDKIHKNEKDLPGDNNPAEELTRSQSEGQYRALDLD